MHANSSTAARTAAAIAAVESVSECFAGVRLTACTVNVAWEAVVLGGGVAPAGTYVVVGVPVALGAVAVGGAVVVGTDILAGVVVVVTGVLVVAPEVDGFAGVGCTRADAGIGKVGVELVSMAI